MSVEADSVSWLRFALASVTVITLLAALAWVLKIASTKGWFTPNIGKTKRMKLLSSLAIDARRRIVLVQKDDKEYTLLIGGSTDVLLDKESASTKSDTKGTH